MDVDDWLTGCCDDVSIRGYRDALERSISFVVTTEKTDDAILFKGKRRYLHPLPKRMPQKDQQILTHAVYALQFLYQLERSINESDSNKTFLLMLAFAEHLGHLGGLFTCGSNVADAFESNRKNKQSAADKGRATTKWTPHVAQLAQPIFAELKAAKFKDHPAVCRTKAVLQKQHGINLSISTLKRHLTK